MYIVKTGSIFAMTYLAGGLSRRSVKSAGAGSPTRAELVSGRRTGGAGADHAVAWDDDNGIVAVIIHGRGAPI